MTTQQAFSQLVNDNELWSLTTLSDQHKRILRHRMNRAAGQLSVDKQTEFLKKAGFTMQQEKLWKNQYYGGFQWTTEEAFRLLVNSDYLWTLTGLSLSYKRISRYRVNGRGTGIKLNMKEELLLRVGFVVDRQTSWRLPDIMFQHRNDTAVSAKVLP